MNKIDFLLRVGVVLRDSDINFRDLRMILCVAKISMTRPCESAEVMIATNEPNARNSMHRLRKNGYLQSDVIRAEFTNNKRYINWKISPKSEKLITELLK
jgi:hypothetical protein